MKRIALFVFLAFALAFSAPATATVSTLQSQIIASANGLTQQFGFPFIADSASDIALVLTTSNGEQTTIPPSQYTVIVNPPATGAIWGVGGSVTFPLSGSPLASGNTLTISRILPLQQNTALSNQGNFYPQAVEGALDVGVMQNQQISARTGSLRGTWVPNTYYNYSDIVQDGVNGNNSHNWYLAALANTSSSWPTDLANGDWILAVTAQLSENTPLPLSISNGGTGQTTAAAALSALGGISLNATNAFTGANSFTAGSITVPTRGGGDNTTNAASTAFVTSTLSTYAPLASPSFTGTASAALFSGPTVGVTNGSSASSGNIGQYIASTISSGSAVSLLDVTTTNITSISLPAGDWDVRGQLYFMPNTATLNGVGGSISDTSGTIEGPSDTRASVQEFFASESMTTAPFSVTFPTVRFNLSSTTTAYLVGDAAFSGTLSGYGFIAARRVR